MYYWGQNTTAILELNFLLASDHRTFASFQMFQCIANSVRFLKMFIGRIFVIYCKRQAVWILSFSKLKLLKCFQANVLVIYTVETASLLTRKVSILHVLGEYPVTDLFSRGSKVDSEIINFALGSLLNLSLEEKYHIISLLYCCFCCRVSCVIPCRYFTLTAQINKSQTLIPRKKKKPWTPV